MTRATEPATATSLFTWRKAALAVVAAGLLLPALLHALPDTVWVRRYNAPGNSADEAKALAIDPAGNVFVTGLSTGVTSGDDWLTIKYLPNGDTAWTRRADGWGSDDDRPCAIVTGPAGNAVVTGYTTNTSSNINYATIKYYADGNLAWVKEYDGPAHLHDAAMGLALDTAGNVCVTGYSMDDSGCYDYLTVKYLPNGDTVWTRRANGWANDDDVSYAVAVDATGNVLVTGYTSSSGYNWNYGTIKYLSDGSLAWVKEYDGPAHSTDVALALVVDTAGSVYVTGYSMGPAGDWDYATVKYLLNGDTAWTRRHDGTVNDNDQASALAVDAAGNVYVTGYSEGAGSSRDWLTIKYLPNGDTAWTRRANGWGNGLDEACAIALDTSGNVIVAGYTTNTSGNINYATIEYLADGSLAWVVEYDGPGAGFDFGADVAIDTAGKVYVTGRSVGSSSVDFATIKYNRPAGITEARNVKRAAERPGPTVLRASLFLPTSLSGERVTAGASLLDICGRKAASLVPGLNDISRLAPGVYFLQTAADSRRSAVSKVIVTR